MLRAPKVVLHILALKTQAHPIHISVCLPFLISPSIYFLLYSAIIGNGQKRVYLVCVIVIERGVADTSKYNYLDLIIPFEFFFRMNISVTIYEFIYYYLYKLIKLNNIFWSLEYVTVRNQYVMTELLKGILLWNVLLGSISYLFFFLTFS